MKIDPYGAIGMILTFLSVAILMCLAIGAIAAVIYGAFVQGSAMAMITELMVLIGLPCMWLGKLK